MKAKDYAQSYNDLRDHGYSIRTTMGRIAVQFTHEAIEIAQQRKIARPAALRGWMVEQEQKWLALCNLVPVFPRLFIDKWFVETFGHELYTQVRGPQSKLAQLDVMSEYGDNPTDILGDNKVESSMGGAIQNVAATVSDAIDDYNR